MENVVASILRRAAVISVFIAALWSGWTANASAQTISVPDANPQATGPVTLFGSSFTATVTGTVTTIRVRPQAAQATQIFLYNGANTGAPGGVGAVVYSQIVNLTDRSGGGFDEIVLTTPFPVTAGNTYAFAFGSANLTLNGAGDTYPGGQAFSDGTSPQGDDLIFQVVQVVAAPIPTLSEWAMILLGLALAGAAALHLQRRGRIAYS